MSNLQAFTVVNSARREKQWSEHSSLLQPWPPLRSNALFPANRLLLRWMWMMLNWTSQSQWTVKNLQRLPSIWKWAVDSPNVVFLLKDGSWLTCPFFKTLLKIVLKSIMWWHGMTNCFDRAETREMLRILSERYKSDRLPHAFLHAPNLAYQFNFNLQSRRGYFNLFTTTGVFMSFKYLRN